MKKIVDEGTSTMNPIIGIDLAEEKEFVNPAFPREIYDRAIHAKDVLNKMFVEDAEINDFSGLSEQGYNNIMTLVTSTLYDAQIAASCGEFTFNFGHGWEFKMPSTRDIMARLQKADENPDLRYVIRFSQTVSHHKDQFGAMTEKLVRYFYIRKFEKGDNND